MALTDKSLFLYGYTITSTNQNIPFKIAGGGSELTAVIAAGNYTLATLMTAIVTAMETADPAHIYTVTADRTLSSNLQNRVTIATNGVFLSLLFSSGTTASTSVRDVIGFAHTDRTGATTYTGTLTTGTALQTSWWGFNYQPPTSYQKNMGNVSVSASGLKETISWSIQKFITVEFRYESQADMVAYWQPLMAWMIIGKPFDFTPNTVAPTVFYSVTLEKSSVDGKGLGFMMKEQLPDFPFRYTTGALEFRLLPD